MVSRAWLLVLVSLSIVLHTLREAQACSCPSGPESIPRAGETIPGNSWLWVSGSTAREAVASMLESTAPQRARQVLFDEPTRSEVLAVMSLRKQGGAKLGYQLSELRTNSGQLLYFVVKPNAELDVGPHEFGPSAAESRSPASSAAVVTLRFNVGAEIAKPPPLPRVSVGKMVSQAADGICHSHARYVRFHVAHEGRLVVVDVDGQASADAAVQHVVDVFEDEPFIVGKWECIDNWPFTSADPAAIRFGVFNLAGQFSGWTEPQEVPPPPTVQLPGSQRTRPATNCLCGLAQPRFGRYGAAWLSLGVVVAGALRVRRSQRLPRLRARLPRV